MNRRATQSLRHTAPSRPGRALRSVAKAVGVAALVAVALAGCDRRTESGASPAASAASR